MSRKDLPPVSANKHSPRLLAVILAAATLVFGLTLTLALVRWQQREIEVMARVKFDRSTENVEAELKRRLDRLMRGLMGIRGMYASGIQMHRQAFRDNVLSRDLASEFPGIRGFGFIERVTRSDLARFVATERADVAAEFAVKTSGDASDLYVIKYVEPLDSNREAWGLDVGQDAVRREAVLRAISSGQATLTSRITLVQDDRQGPGFLYLLPVYRIGAALGSTEQRHAALLGLLYVPIVVSELMDGVADSADGMLDVELFEGDATRAGQLIFDADHHLDNAQGQLTEAHFAGRLFESTRSFEVDGRKLALRASTKPAFDASIDRSGVLFIGIGGGLASVLAALTVWLLAAGRARAQRQAERMTVELDRLARVVQHTSNAVALSDTRLRIDWVNAAFTNITGYTLDEARGKTTQELLACDQSDPQTRAAMSRAAEAGQACRVEILRRAKNGSECWIDTEVRPVRDAEDKLAGFMELGVDITQRVRAEQSLRESEARFSFAVDGAGDGIWDWDMLTGAMPFSGHYEAMLGFEKGEIEPSIDAWIKSVFPDDLERVQQNLQTYLEGGAPVYRVELRLRCKDGDYRWILCRGTIVARDEQGKPVRMIGIHSDITERKEAEAALLEARETAERANRAKSEFLSSMSHELRTPMNAILGFAQVLDFEDGLSAEQRDGVHEILKGGRHLLELINEVLDLAKIESGYIDLSLEPVDLGDLVNECRSLIAPLAAVRHIDFGVDVKPGAVLRADRVRLKQVLLNLLSNAVKYNRSGGSIRLSSEELGGERMRVSVADSGKGIAAERMSELFQPFSRLGAEQSETEGTGIGLTITRRLVELMGGEMGVSSELGVGSTFWFDLPRDELPMAEGAAGTDEDAPRSEAPERLRRVLCIDDNPVNLKLIAKLLGQRRHIHLVTAHTPELGLSLASAKRPDLILLDINMPGMDGYQVLAVLKADADLQDVPVVAVTANAMQRDIERGLTAGFTAYLTKPLDARQFLGTIDTCLNGSGEHKK